MVRRICVGETADVFPGIIARNRAVLEYEKFIHRTFYPYIIHPYSRFRVYWEIFFLVFIPFRLIITTTLWVFVKRNSFDYVVIITALRCFNLVDLILRFFTGYVESKTEIVVLQPKRIVSNYLLKGFIFDFIPSIPVNIVFFIRPDLSRFNNGKDDFADTILNFINILTILRAVSFFQYLRHTSNLFMWYPFLLGMLSTVSLIFLLFLFLINTLYLYVFSTVQLSAVNFIKEQKTIAGRLKLFLDLLDYFIEYLNSSSADRITDFIIRFSFLFVIFFCTIFFIVYLIKFVMLKMKKQEKFLDLENRILSFARKRNLTSSLTQKMLLYFLFLLENKYCKEDEIFHYIPDTFKAEIFFHLCLPLLKNFYAFEDLPTYVLRRLAEYLVYQLFLPNELVMTTTSTTLSMYFVHRGTLALYSANHVELYHFEAGSSVNGRNFVLGEPNTTHYAISIEVTEIYRLDYDKYFGMMAAHPKLLKNIMRKVQQDKSETAALVSYGTSD